MRIFILTNFLLMGLIGFAQTKPKYSPRIHDFDFWLGDWKVYKFGTDTMVGVNKIETIIDSTAILENYEVTNHTYKGKSLNKYNPQTKKWEQYWVDNSGLILHLEGNRVGNTMVMEGYTGNGDKKVLNRIIWTPLNDGSVRQQWDISSNDGKTWQKSFDGLYRKN